MVSHNKSSEIRRCFTAMFLRREVAKLLRKLVGQMFNPAEASRNKKPALVLRPRRAKLPSVENERLSEGAALCQQQYSCAGVRKKSGRGPRIKSGFARDYKLSQNRNVA